jgi:drug/metabolite transporter (DMT)-like permease
MGTTFRTKISLFGVNDRVDRPVFGIICMLAFCLLAPIGDAVAKFVGSDAPLLLTLFFRFGVQFVLLLPLALLTWRFAAGPSIPLNIAFIGWVTLRSGLHILGIGMMYMALRYLPLADALAIAFVMPFILLLLGGYFLGEEVGPLRIAACIVGFGGSLLVIQPSFANVGLPALLPIGVAFTFSIFILITRHIAKDCGALALQTSSGLIASIMLLAMLLILPDGIHADISIALPDMPIIWLLFAIGLIGTVAHLLMTISLRFAPSATLAPMQYLEIPFATVIGWFAFAQFPNGLAQIGIVISILAGLYIIRMEHRTAKNKPA